MKAKLTLAPVAETSKRDLYVQQELFYQRRDSTLYSVEASRAATRREVARQVTDMAGRLMADNWAGALGEGFAVLVEFRFVCEGLWSDERKEVLRHVIGESLGREEAARWLLHDEEGAPAGVPGYLNFIVGWFPTMRDALIVEESMVAHPPLAPAPFRQLYGEPVVKVVCVGDE